MILQTPVLRICISCRETFESEAFSDNDQLETIQDSEISAKEERKR